jgi:hypothetical protein
VPTGGRGHHSPLQRGLGKRPSLGYPAPGDMERARETAIVLRRQRRAASCPLLGSSARHRFVTDMWGPRGAAFAAAAPMRLQTPPVDVTRYFHGEVGPRRVMNVNGSSRGACRGRAPRTTTCLLWAPATSAIARSTGRSPTRPRDCRFAWMARGSRGSDCDPPDRRDVPAHEAERHRPVHCIRCVS